MISICENCAYKMSDCKGNKDIEKVTCEYFKKPVVANYKQLVKDKIAAEVKLADLEYENKVLKDLIGSGGLHNIVQVEHLNDNGLFTKKRYTFNVPDDVKLQKGDLVLCETKHGNPSVARCVTDSVFVSDKILDAIMSGKKVISKVIGKYELDDWSDTE